MHVIARLAFAALLLPLVAAGADIARLKVTAPSRSASAKAQFATTNPCPANGQPVPSCPGYVIDHIRPLCAGGLDTPSNMQWQSLALSYHKDAIERAYCACAKSSTAADCDSLLWAQCAPKGP